MRLDALGGVESSANREYFLRSGEEELLGKDTVEILIELSLPSI